MAEEEKRNQVAASGSAQSESVASTDEDKIFLIKNLFYRIEALVNEANTRSQARDSRAESDRTSGLWWQRISIVGSVALSALTVGVLVLTLLAINHYTSVTQKILDADSRAYVSPLVPSENSSTWYLHFKVGDPLTVPIHFDNFGKSPANAFVRTVITYAPALALSRAEAFPNDDTHLFIWPNPIGAAIAGQSIGTLDNKQFAFLTAGDGYIYVAIEVRYGSHITRICKQYELGRRPATMEGNTSAQDWTLLMPDPTLCSDETANCTDDQCK